MVLMTLPFMVSNAATGTINLAGRTLTAIDGQTYDLGELQAQNYILIFDFWATWCGPCLGSIPGLEEIWDAHGPLGDQTYMIFSIETDQSTSNEQAIIDQYGIQNPVIVGNNSTSVKSSEFAYQGSIPYFTVVCPNGNWKDQTGGIGTNPAPLLTMGNSCGVTSSIENDARMMKVLVEQECPESDMWTPKFDLRNIGTQAITSAIIEVSVDGNVVETINWTGNVASGATTTITAADVKFGGNGVQEVTATIIEANSEVDDNALNNSATGAKSYNISMTLPISLELILDAYPEETGYRVLDETGTVLSSAAAGTYAGATTNPIINITLPNYEKCYTIDLTDSFGDGSGGIIVKNSNNVVLIENKTGYSNSQINKLYTSDDSDGDTFADIVEDLTGSNKFDINNTPLNYNVAIKDVDAVATFNVYPNPATSVINIAVEMKNNVSANVELIDVLGRVINTTLLSNGLAKFETANLTSGIYMINVIADGKSIATSNVVVR